MAQRHEQRHDDETVDQAKRGKSAPEALGVAAMLLRQQQTAGNRATAGTVARLSVQRHAPGPNDAPARPIGEAALKTIIEQGVEAGSAGAQTETEHGAAGPVQQATGGAGAAAGAQEQAAAPAPSSGGLLGRGRSLLSGLGSALGRGASAVGRGASAAAGAVASGARAVGGALASGARAVGGAVASGARAVGGAVGGAVQAVSTAVRRAIAKTRITINIAAHGAPGESQAKAYVDEVFMSSSVENLEAMAGKTIDFHIIPIGTKLTELDEFKSLAGQTTFDGRQWDDVRGIWMGAGPNTIRFAVGAEDLTAGGSGYGDGFVAADEGGHGMQFHGITDAQRTAITEAYTARLAAHPVDRTTPADAPAQAFWLQPEWYSAANENEYFASAVAAWFGHPYSNGAETVARYTKAWLKTNDLPMYNILKSIYG